jgi:murein tripeptide amidase MpaA
MNYLVSRDVLPNKFREMYEVWILPTVNPDGIVAGNYRSNLQGKDMNRHFFADDDREGKDNRAYEVELLRERLKEQFPENDVSRFKMFLDIHAHSSQPNIFMYASMPESETDLAYI